VNLAAVIVLGGMAFGLTYRLSKGNEGAERTG
jgi:hypothetical protein